MKEALFKKRLGISAALLVVMLLLLSGTTLAWYCFTTVSSTTAVQESLFTKDNAKFSDTMHPGETNTWSFKVENTVNVPCTIKADLTYNAPNGVTIDSFKVGIHDETTDLKDDNSAEFDLSGGETKLCSMIISAANDATPGDVSVSLALSRG